MSFKVWNSKFHGLTWWQGFLVLGLSGFAAYGFGLVFRFPITNPVISKVTGICLIIVVMAYGFGLSKLIDYWSEKPPCKQCRYWSDAYGEGCDLLLRSRRRCPDFREKENE